MFVEVNNFLNLPNDNILRNKIFTLSESGADGTFLIHHFLLHSLKNEHPVCFVSLSQSFGHYNVVATKFGTPLTTCKEKGILCFIDVLGMTRQCLGGGGMSRSFPLDLKELAELITKQYEELKEFTQKAPVIIMDNLSVLINIGFSTNHVINLANVLSKLVMKSNHLECERGLLIAFIDSGLNYEDVDKIVLWKYMSYMSDMTVEVSGLDSGYCKEVHGKIKVSWMDSLIKKTSRTMQFRVMDKNVALFAPGMSSAVI